MDKKQGLKDKVLEYIKRKKSVSRSEIAGYFNVTPAAIGKIAAVLLKQGAIIESRTGNSTGGRRPVLLELNRKNIGKILGIYYAPSFIEITLGNINGDMFESQRYETVGKEENIFLMSEDIIKSIIEKNEDIGMISVVANGLIDSRTGKVIFSPHYNIKNFNLKERFEEKFGIRTVVENDVRAMALTEKIFGICQENHNFVVLNIDEGVGGSIYLNDMLYHGYGSMSGELGHMVVKRDSLERCSCGKRGCLETEVSNRAMIKKVFRQIKINGRYSSMKKIFERGETLTIEDIIRAYEEKDVLAMTVVGESIQYMAYAMDMIISVINPEKIVLYGDIFKSGAILDALLHEIKKITLDEQNYEVSVSNFLTSIYKKSPFSLANYMIFKN